MREPKPELLSVLGATLLATTYGLERDTNEHESLLPRQLLLTFEEERNILLRSQHGPPPARRATSLVACATDGLETSVVAGAGPLDLALYRGTRLLHLSGFTDAYDVLQSLLFGFGAGDLAVSLGRGWWHPHEHRRVFLGYPGHHLFVWPGAEFERDLHAHPLKRAFIEHAA